MGNSCRGILHWYKVWIALGGIKYAKRESFVGEEAGIPEIKTACFHRWWWSAVADFPLSTTAVSLLLSGTRSQRPWFLPFWLNWLGSDWEHIAVGRRRELGCVSVAGTLVCVFAVIVWWSDSGSIGWFSSGLDFSQVRADMSYTRTMEISTMKIRRGK